MKTSCKICVAARNLWARAVKARAVIRTRKNIDTEETLAENFRRYEMWRDSCFTSRAGKEG